MCCLEWDSKYSGGVNWRQKIDTQKGAVLATELGINIFDVEIAHSVEGDRGVLVVVIGAAEAATFTDALSAKGHRSTTMPVGTVR